MVIGTIGVINPTDYWSTARSGGAKGLGIVPNPREINRTVQGLGVVNPTDYWSTARSGGAKGLGVVPNDFELSTHRCYLPVHHGWIATKDHLYRGGSMGTPGPGPYSHGLGYTATHGLADGATTAAVTESQNGALLKELVAAEKTKARMAMLSAGAVVAMAVIAVGSYLVRSE